MKKGDRIPGLVGWEFHGDPADDPRPGSRRRGRRRSTAASKTAHWTATIYPGPKGNFVFNASTIFWSQGLSRPPGHMPPYSHYGRPHGPDAARAADHAEPARAADRFIVMSTHFETPHSLCRFGVARCRDHAAGGHLPSHVGGGVARSLDRRASAAHGHGGRVSGAGCQRCRRSAGRPGGRSLPAVGQGDAGAAGPRLGRYRSAARGDHGGLLAHARGRLDGHQPRPLAGRRVDRPVSQVARRETRAARLGSPASRCGPPRSSMAPAAARWPPSATSGTQPADTTSAASTRRASCDDTVLVARATDEQGRTLATIVNYACHPTTLAWENTLISPDYPGAMREVVEGATRAPCVFLQGASGDVGPREGFVGDVRVADSQRPAVGLRRAGRARRAAAAADAI